MNIASPKLWVRGLAVTGVVLLTLAWTGILAWLSDLPQGYGAAQSRNEKWLKDHAPLWSQFRHGTANDLLRYVPGYLVFGIVLIGAVALARRSGEPGLCSRHDRGPVLIALALLVIGAAADVAETLLFRHSLTRLIATSGGADVATLTSITWVMTAVKWTALAGFFVALVVVIVRRPPPDTSGSQSPTEQ
jgi:hypothetical protein